MKSGKLLVAPVLGAALMVWTGQGLAQDAGSSTSGQSGSSATQPSSQSGSQASSSGSQAGQSSAQLSAKDKAFVMKAAKGGMQEVELGQLVSQKAQSDDVKQFAQRMVQDHTKANDELKSLAQQKGVTLPTSMGAEGDAMKAKLEKLSGAQLDKMYMHHMVLDHNKDVHEFQTESKMAKDSDLKSWAEKTLPTLQDHLKQAKDVAAKTGATTTKSSETAAQ
jgi:putative membrane protein